MLHHSLMSALLHVCITLSFLAITEPTKSPKETQTQKPQYPDVPLELGLRMSQAL